MTGDSGPQTANAGPWQLAVDYANCRSMIVYRELWKIQELANGDDE